MAERVIALLVAAGTGERMQADLFAAGREKQDQIQTGAEMLREDVGREADFLAGVLETGRRTDIANAQFPNRFIDGGDLLPRPLAILVLITVEGGTAGVLAENLRSAA